MSIQYWTGAAWAAIPAAALYGTYDGTCAVLYPRPQAYTNSGKPCAAIGAPKIVIETPWMSDAGMNFWRDRIGSTSVEYSVEDFQIWDMRSESDLALCGKLRWPTWASVGHGATAAQTVYRNVRILVTDCIASTH